MEPFTIGRGRDVDRKIKVLVVDDSAFMRKTISAMIEGNSNFLVIGKARNGLDALEKVERLKPDIVTLDIEMPELDGLETLKRIIMECPLPVIMLSNGADSTLEAFEIGAVDFILKKELIKEENEEAINDFHQRILTAATAKVPVPPTLIKEHGPIEEEEISIVSPNSGKWDLLVIGSSTGGPAALQKILTRFPVNFPVPILVIQHMPPGFTKPLADRFNGLCNLQVKEADHNEQMKIGTIYIAPAGLYTSIQKSREGQYVIRLKISSMIESLYKPSIDVALFSIAPLAKDRCLAVILTGMGDDGLRGCKKLKEEGGMLLSESEETCVVYGMPKVVYEAGLVDKQIPLGKMFESIMELV